MSKETPNPETGRFDVAALMARFPDKAETLLLDTYLTDTEFASARIFRVYRPIPAHYHELSEEYLYVLAGSGLFAMNGEAPQPFSAGQLLYFRRRIVHAMPSLDPGPVVFLAIDTPRRHPKDVVFVEAGAGTPEGFVRPLS